jgi:hypothetical protein
MNNKNILIKKIIIKNKQSMTKVKNQSNDKGQKAKQ